MNETNSKTSQHIFCFILGIVAFTCAIVSFWYFDSYPQMIASNTNIFGLVALSFVMLTALMPFISIVVLMVPTNGNLIITRIHAAICFSFIIIASLTSGSPGHSSPLSDSGVVIANTIYIIIFIELLLIQVASQRSKRKGYPATRIKGVFTFTSLAIIGGCSLGILIWSTFLPTKVIAAAEVAAAGREYCFGGRSKAELTGIKMYARDDNGFTWSFHNLMTIKGEQGVFYMNWSYRNGKFDLIREDTRKNMHLDDMACVPIPHYALNLPLTNCQNLMCKIVFPISYLYHIF